MNMVFVNYELNLRVGEYLFDVTVDYAPPCLGARDSYRVPLEPDEVASISVNSIRMEGSEQDILEILSPNMVEKIEEEALQVMANTELGGNYDD